MAMAIVSKLSEKNPFDTLPLDYQIYLNKIIGIYKKVVTTVFEDEGYEILGMTPLDGLKI
jgi:hypothetical protein